MPTSILNDKLSSVPSIPSSEGVLSRIFLQLAQLPDSPRSLPLLVFFAAVMTGALFIFRINSDLNYDGQVYLAAAMKFAEGGYREGLAIYQMPAYPLLISLIYKIFPNWILAGRLISLVAMTLTVIPLYKLSKELFNSRTAFWSSVTYILLPETLPHSNSVLREPVFIFLFMWAAYFAQKTLQSQEIKNLIYSALFVFASTLFRVEGLILFPVCFCVFVGLTLLNTNNRKHYYRNAVAWMVIGALVVAGIMVAVNVSANVRLNHYDLWIAYIRGFWEQHFLDSYNRIADQLMRINDSSIDVGVGHNVAETARTLLPLIYLVGLFQMFSAAILFFNLIPLTWGLIRTVYSERHLLVLALAVGFLALAYGYFIRTGHMLTRYLLTPGLLICPWIGFGIDRILTIVQRLPHKRLAVGCIVLMVFLIPLVGFGKLFRSKDDLAFRAGAWIAMKDELKSSKILFNDQIVKFYADTEGKNQRAGNTLQYVDPSDKDFSRLMRHAQNNKVEAIVIRSRGDGVNKSNRFPGFKELKEFNYKNKIITVYILDTIVQN